MKRGIAILVSLSVHCSRSAYFTASKWAINHETVVFKRSGTRQAAGRGRYRRGSTRKCKRMPALINLPVAILNHGNTVKFTEYSSLANLFAGRGYLAISIQNDLQSIGAYGDKGRRTLCRPAAAVSARHRQHQVRHR